MGVSRWWTERQICRALGKWTVGARVDVGLTVDHPVPGTVVGAGMYTDDHKIHNRVLVKLDNPTFDPVTGCQISIICMHPDNILTLE